MVCNTAHAGFPAEPLHPNGLIQAQRLDSGGEDLLKHDPATIDSPRPGE